MVRNNPYGTRSGGGFSGGPLGAIEPPSKDIWVLLGVLLFTLALGSFAATRPVYNLLLLTEGVYTQAFLWQLVTYAFVGFGGGGFWFVIGLLILFMFGQQVFRSLGRRRFWQLLVTAAFSAALVAAVVAFVASLLGAHFPTGFLLMQGQSMLMTILIAAFATLHRNATILLFFVLPIRARWFLGLEILFAFLGFLNTKDLPGFLGICTAVAVTYSSLTPGGMNRLLKNTKLRFDRWRHTAELERLRRKRNLRVVPPEDSDRRTDDVHKGPWVN